MEAERLVKRYERLTLTVLTPAINQLRYAGHHLFEADTTTNPEERATHLDKAFRHAERAALDARESAIAALLGIFKRFHDSGYPQHAIDTFLPEYNTWRPQFAACVRRLQDVPQLRLLTKEEKQALDADLEELIDKHFRLCEVIAKLDEAQQAEDVKQAERERQEEQVKEDALAVEDNRRYRLSMTLSVIGVALTLFGILLTIYQFLTL